MRGLTCPLAFFLCELDDDDVDDEINIEILVLRKPEVFVV